ncbi:MAG: hypothetical protein WCI03_12735 [bacterium]
MAIRSEDGFAAGVTIEGVPVRGDAAFWSAWQFDGPKTGKGFAVLAPHSFSS